MKKIIMFVILILGLCALAAQDISPWQYVRHSAVDNNNQIHVRFNGNPVVLNDYEFYDWQNSMWNEQTLTNPEPLVYETLLPHMTGQVHNYRLRTSYDAAGQSIIAVNPGFLSADTFPPSLPALGYVADDPVGDSVTVYFSNLDLTGSWAGWSDNKIFVALSNNANSFPTLNSLTSYNLYFAGIAGTTTAVNDSSVYAMLHTFNIPGVISPGLYKLGLNLADSTVVYENIGPVESQVVNGKLMLACNIADLTADPGFGGWPPAFNSLGFMAGSIRIDLDLGTLTPSFGIGDMSDIAQLIFENNTYQPAQNSFPVISDVSITDLGNIYALEFTYFDADQDFPLYAKVILDNVGIQPEITPTIPDFTQPVTMTAILPGTGWENGTIRLSDNNIYFVTYDISLTANQDETLPAVIVCNAYPNPYKPAAGNLTVSLTGLKNKPVSAGIYNLKGQCLKQLSATPDKGKSTLQWDGSDANSIPAANGIYILKIRQDSTILNKKIILVR